MGQQFSLDLFAEAPPPGCAFDAAPLRVSRKVQTRAACYGGIITVHSEDDPDPFEIIIRGVPCVVSSSGGFCTHAIEPPGSPFWSETGFRSFGYTTIDPDEVTKAVAAYIDAPLKAYGCGGKLSRWWLSYVLQWRQSLGFEIEMTKQYGGRKGVWDQWGPEAWQDHWHRHDMKLQDALEQMREEGIDPDDVGPPRGFTGKWPKFGAAA